MFFVSCDHAGEEPFLGPEFIQPPRPVEGGRIWIISPGMGSRVEYKRKAELTRDSCPALGAWILFYSTLSIDDGVSKFPLPPLLSHSN
jgi:hypothetical protein